MTKYVVILIKGYRYNYDLKLINFGNLKPVLIDVEQWQSRQVI